MKAAATTKNKINFKEFGIFIAFFALVIVLMIISPDAFAKPRNLINIIKQASVNGILSCGMMFVIISGGIDLSAGSTIAFAGVAAAYCAQNPRNPGSDPGSSGSRCYRRSDQRIWCCVPESSAICHHTGNHDRNPRSGADLK